jgi:single-stranded DNA-binding protein
MNSFIRVSVLGYVPWDAEVKFSGKDRPYLKFAVNVSNGQDKDPTKVDVLVMDEDATKMESMKRGTNVYVTGRASFGTYEKDGVTKQTITVFASADSIVILPRFERRDDN